MTILVGIDPGANGGIAILHEAGIGLYKMPETESDVVEFFRGFDAPNTKVLIERVQGMPRMGGTAMFTFGKGYGTLRAAMLAFKIPFDDIPPQVWMKALNCSTKGNKNVTKIKAQQMFPSLHITHATADSVLILEYLRRREQNEPKNGMDSPVAG